MANFERRIYIPEEDKNLIYLSLIPPDQKPEDNNLFIEIGETYSVYHLLSLGKGRMQAGLDTAFRSIEFQEKIGLKTKPVYKSKFERKVSIDDDDESILVTVEERSRNSRRDNLVEVTGDTYTSIELNVLGEGSIKAGAKKVHETLEEISNTNHEDIADINLARPKLTYDNRPLAEDLHVFFASPDEFITH